MFARGRSEINRPVCSLLPTLSVSGGSDGVIGRGVREIDPAWRTSAYRIRACRHRASSWQTRIHCCAGRVHLTSHVHPPVCCDPCCAHGCDGGLGRAARAGLDLVSRLSTFLESQASEKAAAAERRPAAAPAADVFRPRQRQWARRWSACALHTRKDKRLLQPSLLRSSFAASSVARRQTIAVLLLPSAVVFPKDPLVVVSDEDSEDTAETAAFVGTALLSKNPSVAPKASKSSFAACPCALLTKHSAATPVDCPFRLFSANRIQRRSRLRWAPRTAKKVRRSASLVHQ